MVKPLSGSLTDIFPLRLEFLVKRTLRLEPKKKEQITVNPNALWM